MKAHPIRAHRSRDDVFNGDLFEGMLMYKDGFHAWFKIVKLAAILVNAGMVGNCHADVKF
jgi:hypothetical protein